MEDWKTKIPLAQEEDTYLAIRTMKSDIETFQKTGEAVPEILMRKDLESVSHPYSIQDTLYKILLIILAAAILFFLFSLYIFFL